MERTGEISVVKKNMLIDGSQNLSWLFCKMDLRLKVMPQSIEFPGVTFNF